MTGSLLLIVVLAVAALLLAVAAAVLGSLRHRAGSRLSGELEAAADMEDRWAGPAEGIGAEREPRRRGGPAAA